MIEDLIMKIPQYSVMLEYYIDSVLNKALKELVDVGYTSIPASSLVKIPIECQMEILDSFKDKGYSIEESDSFDIWLPDRD